MRKILILCLISLVYGGLAQGQVVDDLSCAAVSLKAFLNRRSESQDLVQRIEATASVDELVALTAEYIDTVTVLPFSASFCYEGYDTMWRLDQLLNDAYAAQLMRLLGVADQDNAFLQSLSSDRQLVEEQAQSLEALLQSGERDGLQSTVAGSGDECFYQDMIFPVEQWLAHGPVMESVEAIETVTDVLAVASDIKAWRELTWSVVPACFDPFLHLMELGQLAQFISMQRALNIGGLSEADDPFAETLDEILHPRWGTFGGAFHDERLSVWKRPPPTVAGIATCSLADIESFANVLAEFDNLLADAQSAVDAERKLDFIQRQVAWRHRLWLQMPMCREVLEITWLMRQISSDQAAVFALQMLADDGISAALSARTHGDMRDRLRLRQLSEHLDAFHSSADGDPPKTAEAAFFTCGDQLTQEEYEGITTGYRDLMGQAQDIASADDALRFFDNEIGWRNGYLAGLPGCPEAVELGWWTSLRTTSEALTEVLVLAGVPEAENPYIVENELASRRWFKVSQDLYRGIPLSKEYGSPGASRLRSCSEADALNITTTEKMYDELLKYPRAFSIDEMVEYALTYLHWRDVAFRSYPPCAEAHTVRLLYTQILGDVIARQLLDLDGRLYGDNPWRQLPDDFWRFAQLHGALFDAHLVSGPPPDQRIVPACTAKEIDTVAELTTGITAIAQAAQSLDLRTELPAFHQQILDWRAELMARLPQCAGAVELGWLMNDIHIDLAVLGSLIFVGVNIDALPHPGIIQENVASMSRLAQELGIDVQTTHSP